MPISHRPYATEADKIQMSALASQFREEHLHVIDLPYRLSSWALDDPENVRLWFNEDGQLVAWAALQTPFWTMDYVCNPTADKNLHRNILAWGDERAAKLVDTKYGHPAWFATTFAEQADRIRDLEDAGFACQADIGEDSWSKVLMQRSGQTPVKVYQPPAGFTVRPLAGEKEVEAYVALHRSVFESKNMTSDWRRRTLLHPDYSPDLDLVVESPDGRLVAFCICWRQKRADGSLVGQVEPLGCHKDFRQYALGRVALSHGLHRLQSAGVQEIFLETDSYRNTAFRLYESFDFHVIQDVLVYQKDYSSDSN